MQLQIIEVAIGVVAAFFIVSVIASAAVELVSLILKKRSKDLRIVLDTMLSSGPGAVKLEETSVWQVMVAASRRKRVVKSDKRTPSYLSARSFADGVIEGLINLKNTTAAAATTVVGAVTTTAAAATTVVEVVNNLPEGPLKKRLTSLQAEVGGDLVAIKAGLEGWFDDTMDRLEGSYKRWSQWFLLLFGLLFALALNVSAVRIVDSLWNDAVLRTAVADAAAEITDEPCPSEAAAGESSEPSDCAPEDKIDKAISNLDSLNLPVGWEDQWSAESGVGWTLLGIIPTGLAVMMGAPFWFDLLTRLIGARGTRGVPPKATVDRGSATVEMVESDTRRSTRTLSDL